MSLGLIYFALLSNQSNMHFFAIWIAADQGGHACGGDFFHAHPETVTSHLLAIGMGVWGGGFSTIPGFLDILYFKILPSLLKRGNAKKLDNDVD